MPKKIQQHLYLVSPFETVLDGDSVNIICSPWPDLGEESESHFPGWRYLHPVSVTLPTEEALKEAALEELRAEESKIRAEFQCNLDIILEKKQKLLALTHTPEPSESLDMEPSDD